MSQTITAVEEGSHFSVDVCFAPEAVRDCSLREMGSSALRAVEQRTRRRRRFTRGGLMGVGAEHAVDLASAMPVADWIVYFKLYRPRRSDSLNRCSRGGEW